MSRNCANGNPANDFLTVVGKNSLMAAARSGDYDTVAFLLEANNDQDVVQQLDSGLKMNAWEIAKLNERPEAIILLLDAATNR